MTPKKQRASTTRVYPIPPQRYSYFRHELRSSTEGRAELMRHLGTLIEEESKRHEAAWNELVALAGFASTAEAKAAGMDLFIDWIKCTITLKPRQP